MRQFSSCSRVKPVLQGFKSGENILFTWQASEDELTALWEPGGLKTATFLWASFLKAKKVNFSFHNLCLAQWLDDKQTSESSL